MWQPLLKILSAIGRIRLPVFRKSLKVEVGDPRNPDSESGTQWRRFATTEALWRTWGPVPGSPWEPYHCVTLFAALDIIARQKNAQVGPLVIIEVPDWLAPSAKPPKWATLPGTMGIVDLPGFRAVSAAYYLITRAGFQPVCAFDNWPNALGGLKPEKLLGALIYYAYGLSQQRRQLPAYAPPLWICDRDRTSGLRPAPGGYDNRYIIEDRLLPGAKILQEASIHTIVYVKEEETRPISTDMIPYLADMKAQGFQVLGCSVESAEKFEAVEPLTLPARPSEEVAEFVTNLLHPDMMKLMRSSAGGFGGYVPYPSSGSGG